MWQSPATGRTDRTTWSVSMPGDWIFCQIRVIHGYTDSNLMPANRPVRSLRQGRGTDGAAPLVPLPPFGVSQESGGPVSRALGAHRAGGPRTNELKWKVVSGWKRTYEWIGTTTYKSQKGNGNRMLQNRRRQQFPRAENDEEFLVAGTGR